jgi:hypothetical protein
VLVLVLLGGSSAFLGALVPAVASAALPDGRGWELVSPIEKNGAGIAAGGEIAGGGVLQAASDGGSISYSSAGSFEEGASGAPPGSQYLSARAAAGWTTANLTVPLFSGSYGIALTGVPFQLFSPDLGRSLLLSGRHCRSEEGTCPVANPPLPGTVAPAGYQDYYLRQAGGFTALIGSSDVARTDLAPAEFELTLAGADPDLAHVVLSTCAALTVDASEVPLGEGCDPAKANLYEWTQGSGLSLVNVAPGATLGAQSGAISDDGSRVYFNEGGNLYLRQGGLIRQIDAAAGGGGTFQTAAGDGAIAFFLKAGHVWRYEAATDSAGDLTPTGGVTGVLGASADGSYVYYLAAEGLYLSHAGITTKIAEGADPGDYPPTTGRTRISADGAHLAFVSSLPLTGYNNLDQKTGLPDSEVFLYDATGTGHLRCVSCRANATRPIGSSTIPGAVANGEQVDATDSYKPRALSADGTRVFFDSADVVVPAGDSNGEPDVYQWEAQGPNCAKAAGCIALLSGGHAESGASFVDASLSGDDVFFITDGSLVGEDPGSFDLYDARVGGGLPEPLIPIPCFGDSCQSLPSEPVDPALTTQTSGPGNPKVHYVKHGGHKNCKKTKHKKAKCKKAKHKGKSKGKGKNQAKGKKAAMGGGRR